MDRSDAAEDQRPSRAGDTCLRCGGPLEDYGEEEFRVGGTTGGWKLLFGEWAELGEAKVRLGLLACHGCGRVEFRLPLRG